MQNLCFGSETCSPAGEQLCFTCQRGSPGGVGVGQEHLEQQLWQQGDSPVPGLSLLGVCLLCLHCCLGPSSDGLPLRTASWGHLLMFLSRIFSPLALQGKGIFFNSKYLGINCQDMGFSCLFCVSHSRHWTVSIQACLKSSLQRSECILRHETTFPPCSVLKTHLILRVALQNSVKAVLIGSVFYFQHQVNKEKINKQKEDLYESKTGLIMNKQYHPNVELYPLGLRIHFSILWSLMRNDYPFYFVLFGRWVFIDSVQGCC